MRNQKSEIGRQRPEGEGLLLTSRGVAVALGVSLRTVQRMIHDEEIKPVRVRGWLVRFRWEDVETALKDQDRKWGRKAALTGSPKEEA